MQAQLEYFKQKLFGSSSERRSGLPGQLSFFSGSGSEEKALPELIEPEFIEVKTSKRERKPKADYDEMSANLPIHYKEVNTLSE
nr:transposase [Hungatella hathewayi]